MTSIIRASNAIFVSLCLGHIVHVVLTKNCQEIEIFRLLEKKSIRDELLMFHTFFKRLSMKESRNFV